MQTAKRGVKGAMLWPRMQTQKGGAGKDSRDKKGKVCAKANHRRMLSSLSPQTRRNISKKDRVRVGTAAYEWLLMVATK